MLISISRHLDLYHRFDSSVASFCVLAVIPKNSRGGEWDKIILQKGSYMGQMTQGCKHPPPSPRYK